MTITTATTATTYNDTMIPVIAFGEGGFIFAFLDTTNGMCVKSEDATVEWLTKNDIAVDEFVKHCVNEVESAKELNITKGIISYFSKDDEKIYNFSKTANIANLKGATIDEFSK